MTPAFARWLGLRLAGLGLLAVVAGIVAGSGAAVAVLALGWIVAVTRLRLSLPPRPRRRSHRPHDADVEQWSSLHRLISEVGWAASSPRHYDLGLRRTLQDVAAARLDTCAGLDLWSARDRDAAAALIGPGAWSLIDPTRPASGDSHSRGVTGGQLDELLDRLDSMARPR